MNFKEVPKRGIFGSFSATVLPRKSLYIRQWSSFWILKSYVSSSCVFSFFKKISPITLDHVIYIHSRYVQICTQAVLYNVQYSYSNLSADFKKILDYSISWNSFTGFRELFGKERHTDKNGEDVHRYVWK
jgi:hypothetical protein